MTSLEAKQLQALVRYVREPRKPYDRTEAKREVREIVAEVTQ